jgi:hypothetical protein
MNAPAHCEVAIETDQDRKHFRHLNPDTVAERAPFPEPIQPPSTVQPDIIDVRTFETFIGGAGI